MCGVEQFHIPGHMEFATQGLADIDSTSTYMGTKMAMYVGDVHELNGMWKITSGADVGDVHELNGMWKITSGAGLSYGLCSAYVCDSERRYGNARSGAVPYPTSHGVCHATLGGQHEHIHGYKNGNVCR